jgi:glutamyl-tRNA synthetase
MILGPDGAKLSKRHGAVSVLQYQQQGYLPDALLNYLVRLGWSHGDQEVFSREEMIAAFDIKDVNKAASAFNPEKLLWLNQQHMMRAPVGAGAGPAANWRRSAWLPRMMALLEGVVNAQRERARTLQEMAQNSLFFFRDFEHLRREGGEEASDRRCRAGGCWRCRRGSRRGRMERRRDARGHQRAWHRYRLALGKVAQPLRVALTGGAVSPPIDITVALLGRETVRARIERAAARRGRKASGLRSFGRRDSGVAGSAAIL